MKPSEHPEFFDRPPPPGQSRESGIVLDAQGRFWHKGELVEHPGMHQAFSTWIGRHPTDGRFVLNNGYDWSYITVEDVPFFVRGVRDAGGAVVLRLSDGSEERLDPPLLWCGPNDALYVGVKGGHYQARFTPAAQAALMPWLVETSEGPGLELDGRVYPITRRGAG